jgi:putative polyhydroxyalkanoate system protein
VANLHILREHALGLPKARKIAHIWAKQVEADFDMVCTFQEGATEDYAAFTRSGVNGTLHVTAVRFELNAKLGFLLGAFKGRIEGEIVKNLDDLLAPKPAPKSPHKPAAKKTVAKKAAPKKQ